MADNDVAGHVEVLLRFFTSQSWQDVWQALNLAVESFESLGLERMAADAEVWRNCQASEVALITGNRNDDGPDSLEATIRSLNQASSLPIFTIANADRLLHSPEYAERIAEKLLEYLLEIERYRGAGRIWIP